MGKVALYLFVIFTLFSTPQTTYSQPSEQTQVMRIFVSEVEQLNRLSSTLNVLENNFKQNWLTIRCTLEECGRLQEQGIHTEIVIPFASSGQDEDSIKQNSGIPGKKCVRTAEEAYSSMDDLAVMYPALVQKIDIGDSWQKIDSQGARGYDLIVLKITNQAISAAKPAFFLMGSTHGTEVFSGETALRFGEYLLQNYNIDPLVTALLDNFELHLFSIHNPDGYKIAESGFPQRKNDNRSNGKCRIPPKVTSVYGVDLNRNSSFHWNKKIGSSRNPCNMHYRGPYAASEPETQAMERYVSSIFPDLRGTNMKDAAPSDYEGIFISLHTPSVPQGLVMFPWGETRSRAPNYYALSALGKQLAGYMKYRSGATSSLTNLRTGESPEWAYGTLGVPSYTIEIGKLYKSLKCRRFTEYTFPPVLNALLYAFQNVRRPYQTPAGPTITQINVAVNGDTITLRARATDKSQKIQEARYSFDNPTWAAADFYPLSAVDGEFNSNTERIITTFSASAQGLGNLRHLIYVEAKDSQDKWGAPSAIFFTAPAVNILEEN